MAFPEEYRSTTWPLAGLGQICQVMSFIKTFPGPWEFILYSMQLMVIHRVQMFPNSKQGWQGQMVGGWFGEIQADFWMLLGRCVKGGGLVDYLLSRASTDNTCAVINGVAPMFTQTLALFTKMAIGESISGREHHHRAIKKPYNYHNQAFCTIHNMLYSWKKWGKGEISAKRKQ